MLPLFIGALAAGGVKLVQANQISAASSSTTTATASASFNSATVGGNGWAGPIGNGITSSDFEWLLIGNQGDYSVKFEQTGGNATPTGAALSTWHNLASTVTLDVESDGFTTQEANGTYEIRKDSSGSVLASATWDLEAVETV